MNPSTIPGLADHDEKASTTLTELEETEYIRIPGGKNHKIRDMFNALLNVHQSSFNPITTVGFPKLDRDSKNPVAIDIASGPHALNQADSLLTYMNQILIKGRNLTREETILELETFPSDRKVQYMDIRAPPEFLQLKTALDGFLTGGRKTGLELGMMCDL